MLVAGAWDRVVKLRVVIVSVVYFAQNCCSQQTRESGVQLNLVTELVTKKTRLDWNLEV